MNEDVPSRPERSRGFQRGAKSSWYKPRMQTNIFSTVARLSDCHLLDEVKRLAASERDVTAELIAHLAEIEERGLHYAAGFGSMFEYCRDALHLSEYAAYGRIEAARAARKFPVILEMLADGSLNLTTVGLIGRLLLWGRRCHAPFFVSPL